MEDHMSAVRSRCQTYREETEKLFSEWKHASGSAELTIEEKQAPSTINHGDSVFIRDGVVRPEQWFSQNIRPLFLLKEAYGGDHDWDLIEEHLLQTDAKSSKMWRRVAAWTHGLMGTTKSQIAPYTTKLNDEKYGNEYLDQVAVVNVKKSRGEKNSNMDKVRAYARFDRDRLQKQLELCDPTIIVCGYTGSALDIIYPKVRRKQNENLYYHATINGRDVLVLDYWHPANQYPDIMNYYGLMGIYQAALKAQAEGKL